MKQPVTRIFSCPNCSKPSILTKENIFRPFCCKRCKLIDLGSWAAEEHKIVSAESLLNPTDQDQY